MTLFIRVLLVVVTLSVSGAFAQGNSDKNRPNREFLRPIDAEKRGDLTRRHGLEIGSLEYFAKPGKFAAYEFDIDVLKSEGQTITITPFAGPPIDIISYGIKRDPETGWFFGRWTGEIVAPNSRETYPVELLITTWSIDSDGDLQPPDRNREITLALLEQENAVVLEESVLRLNEKLVYAISGSIRLPHFQRQITITQLADELETIILYEVDLEKAIIPVSDTDIQRTDDTTEIGRKRLRRLEAFDEHVKNLKRDLNLIQN